MALENTRAFVIGGLVAAIVFAITEFILEGVVGILGLSEAAAFQVAFPDLQLGGTAYHVGNILQLVAVMVFAVWLYSALSPRFGRGVFCAVITSFVLWFSYLTFAVTFARLGVLPIEIAALSLAFNLVEIPAAVLAGAAAYDRLSPSPR